MHIAVDCRWIRSAETDGIGRYTLSILSAMLRLEQGNRWTLIFHDPEVEAWVCKQLPRTQYGTLRLETPVLHPRDILALPAALKRLRPDVFFAPNYLTYPFVDGIRTVLVVHDLIPYRYPETRSNLRWKVFYALPGLMRHVLRRVDHLVAVSQVTADETADFFGIPPVRITPIRHGVAPHFFAPVPPAQIHQTKTRYRLPDKPYVFALGRPDGYKNTDALMTAWTSLPDALRTRFVLALGGKRPPGVGPDPAGVHRIGFVPDGDLPALYQGATRFVMPSRYEGFGLPVIESLASGTPVLTSDIPVFREIGGDALDYFDLNASAALSTRLAEVLSEPVTAQRHLQCQEFARRFRWEDAAKRLLSVLERVSAI